MFWHSLWSNALRQHFLNTEFINLWAVVYYWQRPFGVIAADHLTILQTTMWFTHKWYSRLWPGLHNNNQLLLPPCSVIIRMLTALWTVQPPPHPRQHSVNNGMDAQYYYPITNINIRHLLLISMISKLKIVQDYRLSLFSLGALRNEFYWEFCVEHAKFWWNIYYFTRNKIF